jgi:hypothetical protein
VLCLIVAPLPSSKNQFAVKIIIIIIIIIDGACSLLPAISWMYEDCLVLIYHKILQTACILLKMAAGR